jgi:hypothetical protein
MKLQLEFSGCFKEANGSLTSLHVVSPQGTSFDLFLFNVLLNRREMAEIFYFKCEWPIRQGITGATLLRKLTEKPAVDPMIAEVMQENASYFESLATSIQLQACFQPSSLPDSPLAY